MSTIFSWAVEDFEHLLKSCDVDPLTPYILKYCPREKYILEAGCGAGRYVKYLHNRSYLCIGIEYNQATVENVKNKWPGLQIEQGDVKRLPYADNTFGSVISIGVIEYFEEGPQKPLVEMIRVLEPGGIAIVTVPCLNLLRRLKEPFCGISYMIYNNPILRRLFRKRRLKSYAWNLYSRKYNWHVFPEWGEFFEYRFKKEDFETFLTQAGFELLESVPLYQIDELYHEFGQMFARYKNCRFVVYPHGKLLNYLLSKIPFFHNHMHLCVVRKPN